MNSRTSWGLLDCSTSHRSMERIHVDGFTVGSILSISILNKVPAQYHTSLEIKTSSGSVSHSIMCDGPPGQSHK